MRAKTIIMLSMTAFMHLAIQAQNADPNVSPTATYIDKNGNETEELIGSEEQTSTIEGQAPLSVSFKANPENMYDYSPVYEWHFQKLGEETELMVRYEEDTEYTFSDAGTTRVTLKVKLNQDGEELTPYIVDVTIYNSKLSFPNAFSPNDDDYNKTFKAKEYQSIVDFHAYIFNRWGQKLYEWTDPAGDGWDGTYNGNPVKEGTYFLLVKARGADGREYNIRKDVNLLRGYIQEKALNE